MPIFNQGATGDNSMNRVIVGVLCIACLGGLTACESMHFDGQQSAQGAAQSALSGSGNIFVTVNGTTATVSGWVDGRYDEMAILRALRSHPSIEKIINLIQVDPFIF
jgi:hypothetical protein